MPSRTDLSGADARIDRSGVESDLVAFLTNEAASKGFSPTKTQVWVNGMRSVARGSQLVPRLLREFSIEVSPEDHALDVGCGFGGVALALTTWFRQVSAIDIVEERAAWTRRRVPGADVRCGSATRLPWPDSSFRLVISNDVFEHITDAQQHVAASELFRVLVAGGHAFVEVPNRLQLIDEHNFVPFGTWLPSALRRRYVERFSRERDFVECWEHTGMGWERLFSAHGFVVRRVPFYIKGISFLPAHHWQLLLTKPASLTAGR